MRRYRWIILLPGWLVACGQSPPVSPSPAPASSGPSGPGLAICAGSHDTALTLDGFVTEGTPGGLQPLAGAIVELFSKDPQRSEPIPVAAVRNTITNDAGRYLLCFPRPNGGSGLTDPDEDDWEVRARKDGYDTVSKSFHFGYSVWDYGGTSINLELARK